MTKTATILNADVLKGLRSLPDESVQCVVTSPPYWGLRDYGEDGQIGLEATPEEYVAHMVEVFREVHRVLRADGVCWLNLGDSYNGVGRGEKATGLQVAARSTTQTTVKGLKPKDLVGIPWRVAFALQADGWWLRSDVIWAKPNPMPESVTDRPTKSHEYLFLLTKSERYFWDQEAVKEPSEYPDDNRKARQAPADYAAMMGEQGQVRAVINPSNPKTYPTRNLRSVWTITTKPYPEAHFATFPPELPEKCIKAGTSEKGACPECGAPWARVTEKCERPESKDYEGKHLATDKQSAGRRMLGNVRAAREAGGDHDNPFPSAVTTGWAPACECETADPAPCVVLDPFCGAGTTGVVALGLNREFVGIEISREYCDLAERRIYESGPLFNRCEVVTP